MTTETTRTFPDRTDPRTLGFMSRAVQIGTGDDATGSIPIPVHLTTAYNFRDAEHARRLFALEEEGYIYTRIMNPTQAAFEARMTALEGGVGALAVSSGQAAITLVILGLCSEGDEIVSTASLYGGTQNLFEHTLARQGIHVRFLAHPTPESVAQAITPRTKGVYLEIIGNPRLDVPDLEGIAEVAHRAGVPVVVDSTFATPYLCRPIEHGADLVVHSATKFIGGHGQAIGGVLVDGGRFDWAASGRFPQLTEPDPTYHGVRYTEAVGPQAFVVRTRVTLLRDLGPAISPFNAFQFLTGLETLGLRMERSSGTALTVAKTLAQDPRVAWVRYPLLPGSEDEALAKRYLPRGAGAILTFGVRGGRAAGQVFLDHLRLFRIAANVGDTRSLAIHPATTTHSQQSREALEQAGVSEDLVRLSIGLEDPDDILADLDQALGAHARGH